MLFHMLHVYPSANSEQVLVYYLLDPVNIWEATGSTRSMLEVQLWLAFVERTSEFDRCVKLRIPWFLGPERFLCPLTVTLISISGLILPFWRLMGF